jgi:hypothetical protein
LPIIRLLKPQCKSAILCSWTRTCLLPRGIRKRSCCGRSGTECEWLLHRNKLKLNAPSLRILTGISWVVRKRRLLLCCNSSPIFEQTPELGFPVQDEKLRAFLTTASTRRRYPSWGKIFQREAVGVAFVNAGCSVDVWGCPCVYGSSRDDAPRACSRVSMTIDECDPSTADRTPHRFTM